MGEDGALGFGEDAEEFLCEPVGADLGAFFDEPAGRDAGALFGGYGDGGPVFVWFDDEGLPAFKEEAAFAVGSGEHPGFAAGDGEAGSESEVEFVEKLPGFAHEFTALLFGGADDEDQDFRIEETHIDGHGCGNGGITPLAGAIEDAVFVFGAQDLGLDVVRDEAELGDGPLDDVGFDAVIEVGVIAAGSSC